MAEQQTKTKQATKQAEKPETTSQDAGNGSNGGGHKTALRAVALAAASGATAIAARKAFSSGRQESGSGQESKNRGGGGGGDESLVTSMLTSGWDAARDSLLPLAENAATSAGEFLAQSGPELVRETLVPRFIEGFERGRDAGSSEDAS